MRTEVTGSVQIVDRVGKAEDHRKVEHFVLPDEPVSISTPVGFKIGRNISLGHHEFGRISVWVSVNTNLPLTESKPYEFCRWTAKEILHREIAHLTRQERRQTPLVLPQTFTLIAMKIGLSYGLTLNLPHKYETSKVDIPLTIPLEPGQHPEEVLQVIQNTLRDRIRVEVAEIKELESASDLGEGDG